MVYRAREVRTGQRVILKAYDTARLTPTKRQNLDRQIRTLKSALCLLGPQGGAVALERVVENLSGVYLVLQACNGKLAVDFLKLTFGTACTCVGPWHCIACQCPVATHKR